MLSSSAALSRGHAAVRGIVVAGIGAVLIAWPGITLGTVVALFAIYLVFNAVASGAQAVSRGVPGRDRALLGVRALVELIAAIVAVASSSTTVSIMAVIIGIYAITAGGLELAAVGRLSQLGFRGMGWDILGGALSVTTGVALVVWPGIGAVTLAIVFGAYLLVTGGMLLLAAGVAPRGTTVAVEA